MKTKPIVSLLGLALAVLLFAGCASAGNASLKKETEQSVSTKIVAGKTTKVQVRSMFGSPGKTSFTDGGSEIWTYELSNMSADGINYVPFAGLFGSSVSGTKKELVVLFDDANIVKKYSMSESPVSVKTGLMR